MLISWCSNGKHPPCMRAFLLRSCAAFVNKLLVFKRQTSSLSAGLANGGLLHTDDSGFPEMHTRPLNRSAPIAANYHALVQSASIRDENKPDTAALQLSVLTRRTMEVYSNVGHCWSDHSNFSQLPGTTIPKFHIYLVGWCSLRVRDVDRRSLVAMCTHSRPSRALARVIWNTCSQGDSQTPMTTKAPIH